MFLTPRVPHQPCSANLRLNLGVLSKPTAACLSVPRTLSARRDRCAIAATAGTTCWELLLRGCASSKRGAAVHGRASKPRTPRCVFCFVHGRLILQPQALGQKACRTGATKEVGNILLTDRVEPLQGVRRGQCEYIVKRPGFKIMFCLGIRGGNSCTMLPTRRHDTSQLSQLL